MRIRPATLRFQTASRFRQTKSRVHILRRIPCLNAKGRLKTRFTGFQTA
ncbi:molybdopterin biosynthesis protein MoeA [Neisseria bacilliformis ATCC BAA-1200]|uniref:Molybdopterin biosynthesis protein MoeA n=1 Tax=Neisseria bacilliformis ATCC BAA-1200 TaxID=888742 RepID=F2BC71_9NEIS|nr:hypothetical protein [Neisseria bacilliformis]EGF10981.1 molybdopterin biosynthesis protein MoeA [Neisseria bacilliformis ATCC BAA-1200]QMT46576.1 hypothetical protein H3L91_04375 [Neisseria bacilliformis]